MSAHDRVELCHPSGARIRFRAHCRRSFKLWFTREDDPDGAASLSDGDGTPPPTAPGTAAALKPSEFIKAVAPLIGVWRAMEIVRSFRSPYDDPPESSW
jgi:hypothetical protein